MKCFFFFVLFSLGMLSIPAVAKRLTDGFRVAKLRVEFPFHPEWEVPFDPKLGDLLNQPFHYLDKGSQCYVFESKDKQMVIKFFRFNDPRSELKVFTLFNAARIAYEKLKEETGLLYIHLNRTNLSLPTIHLTDAIGRSYRFPLDEYRFAIQKRAIPFEIAMKEAQNHPELLQKRIDQFAVLLKTRIEKGVYNSDPTLADNFGFLESQAIEFDFGNYKPILPHSPEVEFERYMGPFRELLNRNKPSFKNPESGKKTEKSGRI